MWSIVIGIQLMNIDKGICVVVFSFEGIECTKNTYKETEICYRRYLCQRTTIKLGKS